MMKVAWNARKWGQLSPSGSDHLLLLACCCCYYCRGALCLPILVGLGTSFKKKGKGEKKNKGKKKKIEKEKREKEKRKKKKKRTGKKKNRWKEEKSKKGNIGKGRMVPTCLVGLEPPDPMPKWSPCATVIQTLAQWWSVRWNSRETMVSNSTIPKHNSSSTY